jgi:hypothetical protein
MSDKQPKAGADNAAGSQYQLVQAGDGPMTLAECPPGLFLFDGYIGFKSEYGADTCRYYCADSGEYFWGGTDNADARESLIVTPLAVVSGGEHDAAPPPPVAGLLEAHRRFHRTVGCPGPGECYVCDAEDGALAATPGEVERLREALEMFVGFHSGMSHMQFVKRYGMQPDRIETLEAIIAKGEGALAATAPHAASPGSIREDFAAVREAGGKDWDKVADPEAEVRGDDADDDEGKPKLFSEMAPIDITGGMPSEQYLRKLRDDAPVGGGISDDELRRLEELAEVATAGPWRVKLRDLRDDEIEFKVFAGERLLGTFDNSETTTGEVEANAKLCAAARSALPKLLSAYRSLAAEVAAIRSKTAWVRFADKSPEQCQTVLCTDGEAVETADFEIDHDGSVYWWRSGDVGEPITHWMPLPAPPSGGGGHAKGGD